MNDEVIAALKLHPEVGQLIADGKACQQRQGGRLAEGK